MPLDPQSQAILDGSANAPAIYAVPIEAQRAMGRAMVGMFGPPEPVGAVANLEITGPAGPIPIRIYTPEGSGPFPVVVVFHGGGMVFGSVDEFDHYCRALTNLSGCINVSVEYRLAPENKFPVPLEDAYAATAWAAAHAAEFNGDTARVAVLGDSAGGLLAAGVALLARDRGGPRLAYQVLVNPVLDYAEPGTYSMNELGEGYGMTKASMLWCWDQYMASEDDKQNPYFTPLQAGNLSGLPPTSVLTAEYDPLRDEAEEYAAKLEAAGVPTILKRYPGVLHGFVVMAPVVDTGRHALQDIATALRTQFGIA